MPSTHNGNGPPRAAAAVAAAAADNQEGAEAVLLLLFGRDAPYLEARKSSTARTRCAPVVAAAASRTASPTTQLTMSSNARPSFRSSKDSTWLVGRQIIDGCVEVSGGGSGGGGGAGRGDEGAAERGWLVGPWSACLVCFLWQGGGGEQVRCHRRSERCSASRASEDSPARILRTGGS